MSASACIAARGSICTCMLPASLYVGKFNKLREIIPRQMHICVCVCVCVRTVGPPGPSPVPARSRCGEAALHCPLPICVAVCVPPAPSLCQRHTEPGSRGVRKGERGLKGINHGRERRAGGRGMERCGKGGGERLASCPCSPHPSCLLSPLFLLSAPMLMSCDERGGMRKETQTELFTLLLILRIAKVLFSTILLLPFPRFGLVSVRPTSLSGHSH